MPLLVRNVVLRWNEPEALLHERVARLLGIPQRAVRSYGIVRRAIDARWHDDVRLVYHLQVAVDANEQTLIRRGRSGQISLLEPGNSPEAAPGDEALRERPVIVGTGPAGLFAGLLLAERGYRPIVLERGQDVPLRHKALHLYYTKSQFDPENNLLFGIGGAGTYSDGKLYSRTHDPRNSYVLEQLVRFGADPDILISAKPHVGSDKLPGVCRRMVQHIVALGGEVRYGACVTDFEFVEAGNQRAIRAVTLSGGERIPCSVCILGIGHSARDTYRTLRERGVVLEAKPFQMGVRIEHPQGMIDQNQYGLASAALGAADYQLVAKNAAGVTDVSGTDLFSFCMCPGGTILPSNEQHNEICTNGASTSRRNTPYANSGLVVTILPEAFGNDALAGVEYQRQWERLAFEASGSYAVPAQRVPDFLAKRVSDGKIDCSFPIGSSSIEIRRVIPDIVGKALERGLPMLDRLIPGYAGDKGVITAPETRASSPVRIARDGESRQSIGIEGLYPVGEGAGFAGGIVSSATDGMKSAERVIARYRPIT